MSHWDPRDEEEERFLEYLGLAKLADRTIKEYQIMFRAFPRNIPVTEKLVWTFLGDHSGFVARGFIKNYLAFKKIKGIDIPAVRGRKQTRMMNLISEPDYQTLRKALYMRGTRWGLMFDLSYWCGLRREEICKMEPSWIALEEYEPDKPMKIKVIGKGNKERYAVIPANVAKILVKFILEKFDAHELGNKDCLFKTGVHYWWAVLTKVSKSTLGKRYKPHELRHTRATIWLKEGVDILKIQKRLGHSNLSTTEKYTHITTEEVAEDWAKDLSGA